MVVLARVVAPRALEDERSASHDARAVLQTFRTNFLAGADANDIILQARTWEKHDIGTTPGFNGDLGRALRSTEVPFLYMPSETDLYFPVGDARYEAQVMTTVSLVPIPSLWGHRLARVPTLKTATSSIKRSRRFSADRKELAKNNRALRASLAAVCRAP